MNLYYGQIRSTNYGALLEHYGHEPPWPMDQSPHVSLVEAIVRKKDPTKTSYYRYLQRTHGTKAETSLIRQIKVVGELLKASELTIDVEHESVVDGNHRTAVHYVTGVPLDFRLRMPYQTLEFPDQIVQGRRLDGRYYFPDIDGKRVLDIGCCDGAVSIAAMRYGAKEVIAIDADLRSTVWQLRNAWNFAEEIDIQVRNVENLVDVPDVDVVLAFSVVQHIGLSNFVRLTQGRYCVLETHSEGAPLPASGHHWKHIGKVPYSRVDQKRKRDIYWGSP